jgi:hypothetical protein
MLRVNKVYENTTWIIFPAQPLVMTWHDHVTAAMLDDRNKKTNKMKINSNPQGKDILLLCHPTWLPSRDHAKPLTCV